MKSEEVETWFLSFDHPLKEVMLYVRNTILSADPSIKEAIKWKSPTFMYKGNIASFNPRTKKHVSLMFHSGASIPGRFSHFEGSGDVARYLKFFDMKQAESMEAELLSIINSWIKMKNNQS